MHESVDRETVHARFVNGSSRLTKYRIAMVGDGGNLALFLHEVMSFSLMPLTLKGRPGRLLRKWAFGVLVGEIGKSVHIGANCNIRNGKKMFIGDYVTIGDEVSLDVKPGKNKMILADHSRIGNRTIMNCAGGEMKIGSGTIIESYCRLASSKGLIIGSHCKIGKKSCIIGAGHASQDLNIPIIAQPVTCNGPNSIGDSTSIGERVTILDGVRIGSRTVICDNSYVNTDIPDDCVVSGVPAKIVRTIPTVKEE